jgi:glycosyltransferase involved in cell wall biosynthesis
MTGVQRYTSELLRRWNGLVEEVCPGKALDGVEGHLWEQFILPRKVGGRLLFSPSNTGPIAARRQVVAMHDTFSFDYPMLRNRLFGSWYRWLQPRLADRVEYVITVSEFAKSRLLFHTGVAASKVVVIPAGVDRRFSPDAVALFDEMIDSLGFPSRRYFVCVGTLEPSKNHHRLLEAWARIRNKIVDDVWLVLVGSQGPSRIFRRTAFSRPPDRVFLAGRVSDRLLPVVYAGAIACVQVSIYEGFGSPALEAMACGTPVLASNVAAVPEVVGDAAVLVDPFDVEAIAEGIWRLTEDDALRGELRKKGLERARQLSYDETARKTWEVLQTAAAAK